MEKSFRVNALPAYNEGFYIEMTAVDREKSGCLVVKLGNFHILGD